MPNRSKYPHGFDPNYFYLPEPRRPEEYPEKIEDLHEETYSDILLPLDGLREEHPTATHLYLEAESDRDGCNSQVKLTIQRRTEVLNPNYAEEMKVYEAAKADQAQKKAAWEALSRQWKAEAEQEKHTADYQVYLKLKAQFDPR